MGIFVKLNPKATIYADNKNKVLVGQIVEVEEDQYITRALHTEHLLRASEDEIKAYQQAAAKEEAKNQKSKITA